MESRNKYNPDWNPELRFRLEAITVDKITRIDGDDFFYSNVDRVVSKSELKNWRDDLAPQVGDYIWHQYNVETDNLEPYISCNREMFDKHTCRRDIPGLPTL